MVYSYDEWLPMPTKDLFDTLMMLASINAAKDMYEKGLEEVKEFRKNYFDFTTPSVKDLQWYDLNFTNAFGDLVKYADANGIDLIRSAEGRSLVNNFILSRPYGQYAQVKLTADVAKEFYKNLAELQQNGLYNPELTPFEGGLPSDYSTIDSGKSWEMRSPTPYRDAALFSKSYFDKLVPSTTVKTKNGIQYTSTDITLDDLRRIADDAFDDLIKTGQGQLMYKKFLQDYNGDEKRARQAFNDTMVAGNLQRLHHSDDYVPNYVLELNRRQALTLQNMKNQLSALRIANQRRGSGTGSGSRSSSSSGSGTLKEEFSAQRAMQAAATTAILRGDAEAQQRLGIVSASDFSDIQSEGWLELAQSHIAKDVYGDVSDANRLALGHTPLNLFNMTPRTMSSLHNKNMNYLSRMSTPFLSEDFLTYIGREKISIKNDNSWVPFYPEDVSRIYIADDVAMNADGVPLDPNFREAGKYLTDQVRDLIKSNKENLAMRGAGFIVAPMSADGKQHIYAKITLGRLYRGLLSSAIEDKIGGNDERFDKIILQGSDLDDQLKQLKDKVLYFDTGISTLGLNSLSLDEALDAMSGSIALDKKWGVSKNTLYNNPEFINQSDPFAYDMDELIEELGDEIDQETIERILNGTYGQ